MTAQPPAPAVQAVVQSECRSIATQLADSRRLLAFYADKAATAQADVTAYETALAELRDFAAANNFSVDLGEEPSP